MVSIRSRSSEERIVTAYLITHLCGAMLGLQLARSGLSLAPLSSGSSFDARSEFGS